MIARRSAFVFANTVVGAILGFAALKVFAVETGTEAEGLLGQLAFAMGIAGLFSLAVDMGLASAHVKRVSEGRDVPTAVATFALAKVVLVVAYVALCAALAFTATALGILQDTPRLAVVVLALYYGFLGLRSVFTATFDGRQEFVKTQATVLVENLTRIPLMILFALAFAGAALHSGPLASALAGQAASVAVLLRGHGAELLAATYAAAGLTSFVFAALLYLRDGSFGRPQRALLRDYWSFGRHIFLLLAVGTVLVSLDKIVITYFWGAANTGRYFGAQRFSDLIVMIPSAVYTVLFPSLSGTFARGDRAASRAAMAGALRHVGLVVMPLVVYVVAMAGPLLSLVLTGTFLDAVPTLRVLALYSLAAALMYPYSTLLQAHDRPDLTARSAVLATVLNAALNLALVPRSIWGFRLGGLAEVGSALATLVAAAAQFVVLRAAVRRLEGPVPERHLAKQAVAGLAMLAVVLPLAPPDGLAPWWWMLGLFALGLGVYLAALAALREFGREDLALYLGFVDVRAVLRDIRSDLRRRPAEPSEPRAERGEAEPAPVRGERP